MPMVYNLKTFWFLTFKINVSGMSNLIDFASALSSTRFRWIEARTVRGLLEWYTDTATRYTCPGRTTRLATMK